MNIKRVLKAPTEPLLNFRDAWATITRGVYVSDKEDGIRCVMHPHMGAVSQKMLAIPNKWVRERMSARCPAGLDGELVVVGVGGAVLSFNEIQSAIMTREGQPTFHFLVFDCFRNPNDPYYARMQEAQALVKAADISWLRWMPHKLCKTIEEIEALEADALQRRKEGVMLNGAFAKYKQGRSTLAEGALIKVKRFTDDEAIVKELEEEMENTNPQEQDAGGLAKRSSHKANLKGKGRVGVLICEWQGKTIRIGSGLNDYVKLAWWNNPDQIVGKRITFKYQAHGMKDLPRAPIFKGIRHD